MLDTIAYIIALLLLVLLFSVPVFYLTDKIHGYLFPEEVEEKTYEVSFIFSNGEMVNDIFRNLDRAKEDYESIVESIRKGEWVERGFVTEEESHREFYDPKQIQYVRFEY